MSRLIDADDPKLRGKLKFIREAEGQIYGRASWCFSAKCEAAIDDAPTVDAVPVRRGKWLKEDRGHVEYSAVCDKCGYDTFWCEKSNFCPHCGADMREDDDNG